MSEQQPPAVTDAFSIRHAENEKEVLRCHPLMRQLRPRLGSAEEFLQRWHSQARGGYRLLVRWLGAEPVALAGYRLTESLIHGRHLYVDDLVSEATTRGQGHGAELLRYLKAEARDRGCEQLVLDSGLSNVLAHRFYYREGLLGEALHFSMNLS
ncbi:MAG: putative acetyltransferase [Akkermansiaceae bacterium]|nr:putative acetyltransferase [Akkermansiaceae bacterium]